MKIYTKKGDSGHTSLIDGQIVNKHNLSVDASLSLRRMRRIWSQTPEC